MSPADLAALRRLVDILEGPRAELVPAEALHAVALVGHTHVEKGLRDVWRIWSPLNVEGQVDVDRAGLVAWLRTKWVPDAKRLIAVTSMRITPLGT